MYEYEYEECEIDLEEVFEFEGWDNPDELDCWGWV